MLILVLKLIATLIVAYTIGSIPTGYLIVKGKTGHALCVENEIDYKLVYPSEWRKECNFLKGNDLKRENQKKIAQ